MVEHKCNKEEAIDEIKQSVKRIEKILIVGNGVPSVSEMARRSFEWMQVTKASKNGTLDWVFRSAIGIILVFIATKVGLK